MSAGQVKGIQDDKEVKQRQKWAPEEIERFKEVRKEKRRDRRQRRKDENAAMGLAKNGPRVRKKRKPLDFRIVVDVDFEEKMPKEKEIKSLCRQLEHCYAANRRAAQPVRLQATSFTGLIQTTFDKMNPQRINWQNELFQPTAEDYLALYPKDRLVYLTADSDNVLEEIDQDDIYIIGGIVDHNQFKSLCLNKAIEQGIRHARLPIDQFVKMSSRKVLAVNHVFEILLKYLETNNWESSFLSVIPQRKGAEKTSDPSEPPNQENLKERQII